MSESLSITIAKIESLIITLRDQRVMLDSDLAKIYGVSTSRLNEQFKRNQARFPKDFAFQLTRQEFADLMSQIATSNRGRGGRTKLPWAFSEHGAIMLAMILNSPVAVEASVRVVRAFVFLREKIASNHELAQRISELEGRIGEHDEAIKELFEAIRQLLQQPEKKTAEIGFHVRETAPLYRLRPRKRF